MYDYLLRGSILEEYFVLKKYITSIESSVLYLELSNKLN